MILKKISHINTLLLRLKNEAIELQATIDCMRDGKMNSMYIRDLRNRLESRTWWINNLTAQKQHLKKEVLNEN